MLPHVDRLLPTHNLESLEQLVALLASDGPTLPPLRELRALKPAALNPLS
jgi:hypothetical protein